MGGVLRGIFGYCFLIFIVRIVGRRPGKQITPSEFVLIFFMGGVTLTPMVGDDRSLTNALLTITSIAVTHFVIAWLRQRFPAFAKVVDGTPLVLLKNGKWQTETMVKMGISEEDVMAMARDQQVNTPDDIEYAVLERNGEISVIPASADS
ncbi:MAG: DUF421 domain-containing protein [Acidobacteriaceae bacterium]|nr:DUF421 domain-containing protein [Acidobacteriaceae bacterium]